MSILGFPSRIGVATIAGTSRSSPLRRGGAIEEPPKSRRRSPPRGDGAVAREVATSSSDGADASDGSLSSALAVCDDDAPVAHGFAALVPGGPRREVRQGGDGRPRGAQAALHDVDGEPCFSVCVRGSGSGGDPDGHRAPPVAPSAALRLLRDVGV